MNPARRETVIYGSVPYVLLCNNLTSANYVHRMPCDLYLRLHVITLTSQVGRISLHVLSHSAAREDRRYLFDYIYAVQGAHYYGLAQRYNQLRRLTFE